MLTHSGKRRDRVSRASRNPVLSNILTYATTRMAMTMTITRGESAREGFYFESSNATPFPFDVYARHNFSALTLADLPDLTEVICVRESHVLVIIPRERTPGYEFPPSFS